MTPFVVNMACLSGYFIYPFAGSLYQSLAEGFMRTPGAGAVAALMPTAMTATDGQHVLSNALYEALFAEDRRVLGEALMAAREALLANGGASYQQTADTFMLFGDPATVLKVPLPRRPAGLAVAWQNGQALLAWSAARDCDGHPVAGYHVYRRAAGEPAFTRLTETPVSALAFTDTGLTAGITYTYAVAPWTPTATRASSRPPPRSASPAPRTRKTQAPEAAEGQGASSPRPQTPRGRMGPCGC